MLRAQGRFGRGLSSGVPGSSVLMCGLPPMRAMLQEAMVGGLWAYGQMYVGHVRRPGCMRGRALDDQWVGHARSRCAARTLHKG